MIGIYKIENIINHKIYIGQSIRIMKRWNEHINVECDSLIHKAIKEYGYSNFTFTILELCKKDELDVKEIDYILEYNSIVPYGYNIEPGGKNSTKSQGMDNHSAILTNSDVFEIRECYKNLQTRASTYLKYKDKISLNGFIDVWLGKSWKYIHMDVYKEQIKQYQKNNFDRLTNHKKVVTENEVKEIRDLRNLGELTKKEVETRFPHINKNTFNDIWYNNTFLNIQSGYKNQRRKGIRLPRNQNGENNPYAKYTNIEVCEIRQRRDNGESIKDVYKCYSNKSTYSTFKNIWINKTYKGVKYEN